MRGFILTDIFKVLHLQSKIISKMSYDRCLLIMYNGKKSNFEKFFERDGSVSIHHQNIRFLAIEMFKVFKGINPQMVKDIFKFRDAVPYQLRKQTDFQIQYVHTGTEIIKFLGPKI